MFYNSGEAVTYLSHPPGLRGPLHHTAEQWPLQQPLSHPRSQSRAGPARDASESSTKPVLRLYVGSVLTRKDHPLTAATAAAFEPAHTYTGCSFS